MLILFYDALHSFMLETLFNYDKHTKSQKNLKKKLYLKQITILKILELEENYTLIYKLKYVYDIISSSLK